MTPRVWAVLLLLHTAPCVVGDRLRIYGESWCIRWRAERSPRSHQRSGLPSLYAEAPLGGLTSDIQPGNEPNAVIAHGV